MQVVCYGATASLISRTLLMEPAIHYSFLNVSIQGDMRQLGSELAKTIVMEIVRRFVLFFVLALRSTLTTQLQVPLRMLERGGRVYIQAA